MKKQVNDLKTKEVKSKCFKSAVGIFSFFSSTNVETKNVCPIAYNVSGIGDARNLETLNYKQAVKRVLPIPC